MPEEKINSRRKFVAAAPLTFAAAFAAAAQERKNTQKAEHDHSASDPGQENQALLRENPNSNFPPPTDHGDVGALWYSFDLVKKRIQEGGWTHQVTQRELPTSTDLAGVNMRLTAGSYRELHWHTADEWSYMLYGKARVTVFDTQGRMFVDDVSEGDIWFFPAGFPHSIQGLNPDGCEFLLVFNQGNFSEDNTFLLSEWLAHTPPEVLTKNCNFDASDIEKLPTGSLYIFPGTVPQSLQAEQAEVGGDVQKSSQSFTFALKTMAPTKQTKAGEVRIADSTNFTASKRITSALVTVKPGGMRELHWHPNSSEWQFYIAGKGRMTVFMPVGEARTMDFKANDVGFVHPLAGHYIENTGDTDLVFLEMFPNGRYEDFSLNHWIRRLPSNIAKEHLQLPVDRIHKMPAEKLVVL